jgi:hypothetical protein
VENKSLELTCSFSASRVACAAICFRSIGVSRLAPPRGKAGCSFVHNDIGTGLPDFEEPVPVFELFPAPFSARLPESAGVASVRWRFAKALAPEDSTAFDLRFTGPIAKKVQLLLGGHHGVRCSVEISA